MKYAYLYVRKEDYNDCLKYGIKLSDYSNKSITLNDVTKQGFICYITPKDCELYNSKKFNCVKIDISELKNVYVIDDTFEDFDFFNLFVKNVNDYTYGDFENPKILICTSVIPEKIFTYNKIIDSPIPYNNSKEYYYLNKIYHLLEENKLDLNQSLDYLLHSMVDNNQAEYFSNEDETIQIFVDKNNKKYTVCK